MTLGSRILEILFIFRWILVFLLILIQIWLDWWIIQYSWLFCLLLLVDYARYLILRLMLWNYSYLIKFIILIHRNLWVVWFTLWFIQLKFVLNIVTMMVFIVFEFWQRYLLIWITLWQRVILKGILRLWWFGLFIWLSQYCLLNVIRFILLKI